MKTPAIKQELVAAFVVTVLLGLAEAITEAYSLNRKRSK